MPWGPEEAERLAAYLVIEVVGHAKDLAGAVGTELVIATNFQSEYWGSIGRSARKRCELQGRSGRRSLPNLDLGPLIELMALLGQTSLRWGQLAR